MPKYGLRKFIWLKQARIQAWKKFWKDYRDYGAMCQGGEPKPTFRFLYPCIGDDRGTTPIEPQYFYQNAWAFEHLIKENPSFHVDVGSHHGFVSLLSKVVPVTMVDIRPLYLEIKSLKFTRGSILSLPFENESLRSVSSLCVIEHIGLGRYGDGLDPNGTEKAIAEFFRVLSPGGLLYISLPLDDETTVYFNAHRAFAESELISKFTSFEILDKKYIYGKRFGSQKLNGFGVGCYKLRKQPV